MPEIIPLGWFHTIMGIIAIVSGIIALVRYREISLQEHLRLDLLKHHLGDGGDRFDDFSARHFWSGPCFGGADPGGPVGGYHRRYHSPFW